MLWHANMLHENRDLAGEDLSLVIEAAAVAFASQHLCIILSSLVFAAYPLMPYAMLQLYLVSHTISPVCDLLIVRTSGTPSLGCPRGRLVVSSASVRCSGSGRRAVQREVLA